MSVAPRTLAPGAVLLAAAVAYGQAPAVVLPQAPSTYAGRTLAQWLRPGALASVGAFPAPLAAEVTREKALAAFGVAGDPLEWLHGVVRDPGEPPQLALALATIPELPARERFAAELLARWRAHRDDAATLRALLAVDPAAWGSAVDDELRAHLAAALRARGATATIGDPLWSNVPPAPRDGPAAWDDLLGEVLDRTERLPEPALLPAAFRHHARLVAAIVRVEGTALPRREWLDVLWRTAPELAPQLAPLERDLRAELATLAKRVLAWGRYPDYDRPQLDPTRARQLGCIGQPALALANALATDADPDVRRAGLLALGQMARSVAAPRATLVALLRADAAEAAKQLAPQLPDGHPLNHGPRWPLLPTSSTRVLHEAARIAGQALLRDLLPLLAGGEPPAVKIAVLDCLRAMWGLPLSSGGMQGPIAEFRLDAVLPLLADADQQVRDAALLTAVGLAPHVPMTPAELAKFDVDARGSKQASPHLHVAAWRCWARDGGWLLRVAEQCEPAVANALRIVAQTSPGTQPLAKPPPTTLHAIYHGAWYHRVQGCDRAAAEPRSAAVVAKLAEVAAADPDRLVREHAKRAHDALTR